MFLHLLSENNIYGERRGYEYYLNVVGVVKDFHFTSFRNEIKPFAFVDNPNDGDNSHYKTFNTDNMKVHWRNCKINGKFSPERPFEYYFLDETFARLYQRKIVFKMFLSYLSSLLLSLPVLGLFGLPLLRPNNALKKSASEKCWVHQLTILLRLLIKRFFKTGFHCIIIASLLHGCA